MPLVDSNDPALWDGGVNSLYRASPNGTQLGYEREAAWCYLGNDVEKLIAALESVGLTKTHRVVLVGAGFGWVAEKFLEAGYGPMADGTANGKVCAVDTSTWIQDTARKAANATVTIINADVNASTGRRTIRQQFGSNNAAVDWCVTEDVLPILTDAECGIVASAIRQLVPNVAHWLTTGTRRFDNASVWAGDPRLNWKTLEDWKALMTPDYVIERSSGRVL